MLRKPDITVESRQTLLHLPMRRVQSQPAGQAGWKQSIRDWKNAP